MTADPTFPAAGPTPGVQILEVLARLRAVADGPLPAATNMPAAMYHSDEVRDLERDRAFARDWVSPGLAAEIPDVRIEHLETPGAFTADGAKGAGEGGAIGAPAAVLNAVNDALRPLGGQITQHPMTPERVLRALGKL